MTFYSVRLKHMYAGCLYSTKGGKYIYLKILIQITKIKIHKRDYTKNKKQMTKM